MERPDLDGVEYAYVNPVVAVFLGWAVLSERVTATIATGALAILLSVGFVLRREGRPPSRSATDSKGAQRGLAQADRSPGQVR